LCSSASIYKHTRGWAGLGWLLRLAHFWLVIVTGVVIVVTVTVVTVINIVIVAAAK